MQALRWPRKERPKSDHTGDFGSTPSIYLPALAKEREEGRDGGGRIGTDRGRQRGRIYTETKNEEEEEKKKCGRSLVCKNSDTLFSTFTRQCLTLDSRLLREDKKGVGAKKPEQSVCVQPCLTGYLIGTDPSRPNPPTQTLNIHCVHTRSLTDKHTSHVRWT